MLMRGVVYSEDDRVWNVLLSNVSTLESYFARLGLRLVVVESDGMAYLRQLNDEEATAGYDSLPKLFRATRMSYGQTLLCVLLRDEVKMLRDMQAALKKLEEQGFVAQFGGEPTGWEVRRILKARLPASHLEELRDVLAKHAGAE